jgi:hypothetical protein
MVQQIEERSEEEEEEEEEERGLLPKTGLPFPSAEIALVQGSRI